MMLYWNTIVKIRTLDCGTDFFNIVGGILEGDKLASYLRRMSIDIIKENGFTIKKARSTPYTTGTIGNAAYAEDIALLANIPTQAESQLYSLEQETGGIGFHVNPNKTEYLHMIRKDPSQLGN